MGGSRGSRFINKEAFKIMPQLVSRYKVLHIVGRSDFDKYKDHSSTRYKVFSFIDPMKIYKLYEESDLFIGRAGANTVSELVYIKRPAILIPLPRTYMDEQYKNAKYAQEFGIARVLLEKEVNSESLLNQVMIFY